MTEGLIPACCRILRGDCDEITYAFSKAIIFAGHTLVEQDQDEFAHAQTRALEIVRMIKEAFDDAESSRAFCDDPIVRALVNTYEEARLDNNRTFRRYRETSIRFLGTPPRRVCILPKFAYPVV